MDFIILICILIDKHNFYYRIGVEQSKRKALEWTFSHKNSKWSTSTLRRSSIFNLSRLTHQLIWNKLYLKTIPPRFALTLFFIKNWIKSISVHSPSWVAPEPIPVSTFWLFLVSIALRYPLINYIFYIVIIIIFLCYHYFN